MYPSAVGKHDGMTGWSGLILLTIYQFRVSSPFGHMSACGRLGHDLYMCVRVCEQGVLMR